MQIHCPICSTSIEVPEAAIGGKGRCTTCSTKFIIPPTADGEFHILERGEAPERPVADAARRKPKATAAPGKKSAAKVAPRAAAIATGGAPAPSAHAARIAMRSKQRKGGSAGFMITCVLVAGGLVFAWVKLADDREAGTLAAKPADTSKPKPKPPQTASPVAPTTPGTAQPTIAETTPDSATVDAPAKTVPFEAPAGEEIAELSDDKKAKALAYLKSDLPNKRQGAYMAMRNLGGAHKQTYAALLGQAREHHLELLGDQAFDLSVGDNSLTSFEEAHEEWEVAADSALKLIQTNWKATDPGRVKEKHQEMDGAFENVARLHGRLPGVMENAGGREIDDLQKLADVVTEIDGEVAWTRGNDPSASYGLGSLIAAAGGADDFVKVLNLLSDTRSKMAEIATTEKHNAKINWGTSGYKTFAKLLNGRRVTLGLAPLRLDQQLSDACEGHSGDMLFLDYFSHTGNDGSSFGQRAKRANFSGSPSGECIFKGSAAPNAAHSAWWYSDGHRLIMYAGGPNTLGLGVASEIWTLNTGRRKW